MGGGLVQLAAYGSQDVYLTTNPQITYFKTVYKRYTNFSMESIYQLIEGNPTFGGNITITVSRNGDLLGNVMLQLSLFDPSTYINDSSGNGISCGWIQGIGNYLINNATLNIGGQQIDQQYGKWMDIWSELNLAGSQLAGYGAMVGKNYQGPIYTPYNVNVEPNNQLQIPLQFWFCRNPGLAIPLIALQYHEVKIQLQFEKFVNLIVLTQTSGGGVVTYLPVVQNNTPLPDFSKSLTIWNTYYYLDTTERRQFAQNAHEYLIEQVQTQNGNLTNLAGDNYIRLQLNHPTKDLIFVFNRNGSSAPMNDFSVGNDIAPCTIASTSSSTPPVIVIANTIGIPSQFAPLGTFKLLLNGTDRFKERPGEYFRLTQNYFHHTRCPSNYIYTYSFALRPEEHQPSGTCNFSRIDTAQLNFVLRNTSDPTGPLGFVPIKQDYSKPPMYTIYAPSYNILRIMGGMAGLSYSN